MTVPQQTQFSPAVQQKNSAKLVAEAKIQTSLTSSTHQLERTPIPPPLSLPPPHLPTRHEKPSHTTPIPSSQTTGNEYESEKSDADQSATAEQENKFNAYGLVDITPAKPNHRLAPGRPKKGTLDLFLQKCFRASQPGKHLH